MRARIQKPSVAKRLFSAAADTLNSSLFQCVFVILGLNKQWHFKTFHFTTNFLRLLTVCFLACMAGQNASSLDEEPPTWFTEPPSDSAYYYGVGISQESMTDAETGARADLILGIAATVKQVDNTVQITATYTQEALPNLEIIMRQPGQINYALARLSKKKFDAHIKNQRTFEEGKAAYERGDYATALQHWRPLAEQGDTKAQNQIGFMCLNGYGVHQNYTEALEWFRKAAEQEDADAQYALGGMYETGKGVRRDYREALKWYRKAAEQEDADAQYALGGMYETGKGVREDDVEAGEWYRKAAEQYRKVAEQGDADAQYTLGGMYEYGAGVRRDYREALKWYRKASEQGDINAQYSLGGMYERGKGVDKDDVEAAKWYGKVVEHYRKAAEQGETWALSQLGFMYERGKGVDRDDVEAEKWHRKAAEQGSVWGQYKLGNMYEHGYVGVDKDDVEAAKWYRKAAEQGYADAQYQLGSMYKYGEGVPKDDVEAAKWYRKAAEQEDTLAQYRLGDMYRDGEGVAKDYTAAYMWYTLAAARINSFGATEREELAKQMTASQIAEAERRAHNWKPGQEQSASTSQANSQHQKSVTIISTSTQRQEPSTSAQALPPILSFKDITLSERVLDAEETATLSIRIKNVGPGDARDLKLQLSGSLTDLTFPKTMDVPTIPKDGGEKTVNVSIRGGLNLPTATAAIDIHLNEPHFKQRIQGKRLTFNTRAFRNPELFMADAVVLENISAAPNNRIDLNEMIDLKFYVQNRGVGTAEQIKVQVLNNQKGVMWLGVADATGLKQMAPTFTKIDAGKYELVTYTYFVNSEFTDTELQFDIQVTEEHGKYGFSETKAVAIDTQLKQLGNIKTLDIDDNEDPGSGTVTIEDVPALEIDVRKDIPETTTKNPNAAAVVIGNRNYTNPGVPDVAYAENDALIIKQYLIQTLGYSEENIHYHVNATKGIFEEIFGNEATHKGSLYDYVELDGSSDIFIYYSGHGAPDLKSHEPYLVPVDADPSKVKLGGYPLKLLCRNLKRVPYRSATVVIDSCFSGMSADGELIPGAKGYGIPLVEIPLLPPEKSVIFTATNKRQVANGYSDKQHSLFTYFFLKALRGDADVSKDNQLTVDEIYTYISKHVPRTSRREYGSSREQTPQVVGNKKLVIVQY